MAKAKKKKSQPVKAKKAAPKKKPAKKIARRPAVNPVKKPPKKVAASRAKNKASIKQTRARTPGRGGQPMQAPQEENSLVTPASPPSTDNARSAPPMPTLPEPTPLIDAGGDISHAT